MTRDELVTRMTECGYDADSIASECISYGFDTAEEEAVAKPKIGLASWLGIGRTA